MWCLALFNTSISLLDIWQRNNQERNDLRVQDIEKYVESLKREAEIQKTVKDTMRFSSESQTQLFEKFAEPEELKDGDSVSRELPTGNFDADLYTRVTTLLSIRGNFVQFRDTFLGKDLDKEEFKTLVDEAKDNEEKKAELKDYKDKQNAKIWINSIIKQIGDDVTVIAAASKGKKGWLGNLIITSKRIGEVATMTLKEKGKSIFGM